MRSRRFLQHYRESADYLERTYAYIERVGIEPVRERARQQTGEALLERYRIAKAATEDPWRERHDPSHPKQFAELETPARGEPALVGPPAEARDDLRLPRRRHPAREGRSVTLDGRRIAIFRLPTARRARRPLPARRRPAGRRDRRRLRRHLPAARAPLRPRDGRAAGRRRPGRRARRERTWRARVRRGRRARARRGLSGPVRRHAATARRPDRAYRKTKGTFWMLARLGPIASNSARRPGSRSSGSATTPDVPTTMSC